MTADGKPPATVSELATWAAKTHSDTVAIRYTREGILHELSYVDLESSVNDIADGLIALGVRPGDRVALLAETRPEWTICDLAIASVGAICVPVYPTSSAEECAWVLGNSEARAVICENLGHFETIGTIRDALPDLELIAVMEADDSADVITGSPRPLPPAGPGGRAHPRPTGLRGWGLTTTRSTVDDKVEPDDPATIVYTSGTTGPPKGCVLTHRNWRASLDATEACLTLGPGDTVYIYLPLAHMFSRMVQLVAFECGATLHYFGGDISQVVAELATVRPTHLPSVPRMFEKVYRFVTARTSIEDADETVFAMVRQAFGGRLREALTGAAPIAPEILEFFDRCGIPIYEAYGMTESAALISANLPGAVKIGTVGRPFPGVEVRIAEDGEVLARGDNVFAGYHNNPGATAAMLHGGWLHTGDLGELDADGYLRISGRKKDIIITTGGKNLTPANLENDLRRSRWIAHAVMLGDRRPYPVGLITLDAEEILPWARDRGLPDELSVLARHPEVHALIDAVVRAANNRYAPPERIRRFAILPAAFSVEGGELTPSLKIRRQVISERYAPVLERLYE
jgi:long-chain acyl-CoA synthetase